MPMSRRMTDGPAMSVELSDTVVRGMFAVGLHLQRVLPDVEGAAEHRLRSAIEDVDRLIRAVRRAAFAAVHPADDQRSGGETEAASADNSLCDVVQLLVAVSGGASDQGERTVEIDPHPLGEHALGLLDHDP